MKFKVGLCRMSGNLLGRGGETAFQPKGCAKPQNERESKCPVFSGNPKQLRAEHNQQAVCAGGEECAEGHRARPGSRSR